MENNSKRIEARDPRGLRLLKRSAKLLIACGGIVIFGSCNSGTSDSDSWEGVTVTPKTFGDSLSYYIGQSQGYMMSDEVNQLESEDKLKFDKSQFMRGFTKGFDADFENMALVAGMSEGLQLASQLNFMDSEGMSANRNQVYYDFEKSFNDENLKTSTVDSLYQVFSHLMSELQRDTWPRDDKKSFGDSLALYLGTTRGAMVNQQLKSMPQEDVAKFNRSEFLSTLKQVMMTHEAESSYLDGLGTGIQFNSQLTMMKNQDIDVNKKIVLQEFKNSFMKDTVSQEAVRESMDAYQRYAIEAQRLMSQKNEERIKTELAPTIEENRKKGEEFMAKLKSQDSSIKTTESGLSYKVLKEGSGPLITDKDRILVHYEGQLIDGTKFDSSYDRGEPVEFTTSQVIQGFADGLRLMNKGAKYVLYIPADLAYGDRAAGTIPPGSTLIFTMEVVDVNR